MKRRSFLKMAGSGCAAAALGWKTSSVHGGYANREGEDVNIDVNRLQNRNQDRS